MVCWARPDGLFRPSVGAPFPVNRAVGEGHPHEVDEPSAAPWRLVSPIGAPSELGGRAGCGLVCAMGSHHSAMVGVDLSTVMCTAGSTSDRTTMPSSTKRLNRWNVSRLSREAKPP